MNNYDSFWKKWNNYLYYFILYSIVVSLFLTRSFITFQISIILLPITYILANKFYYNSNHISSKEFITKLFVYSLMIRILSIFILSNILTYYIGIPFLSYKDDFTYNEIALQILKKWEISGIGFYSDIRFSTGYYSGFPNFSAFLMYFFGNSIYIPRLGNALFSAWTCIYAYKIARSYADEEKSKLVGILFMVSPLLFIYSSLQLKDTFLLFLIFGAIKTIVDIFSNKITYTSIIKLSFFLIIMTFFRAASIIPILVAFIFTYIYYFYQKGGRHKLLHFFAFVSVIIILFNGWRFLSEMESINSPESYFESRYSSMVERNIENSNIGISKTPLVKFIGTPIYLIAGLFLPPALLVNLPNQETINYTFVGLLFHFSLLPFLIVAILNVIKNRKSLKIPLFILMTFIFFKIGQANTLTSILDPRQSLATIFLMYLLLPNFFISPGNKSTKTIIIFISMIIMIAYSIVRLYSRGLL